MSAVNELSPAAVRSQVKRVEQSALFRGSDRLCALLRFLVEETLGGHGRTLKESVIGNAIYGRDPPYDPRVDSTVRVEARRLRTKLSHYYASEGQADGVLIELPTGGYVPRFSLRSGRTVPGARPKGDASPIFVEGSGAAIAVLPLRSLSREPDHEEFADGLTDEVIYALGSIPGLRVTSRSTVFQYKNRSYSVPELALALNIDALVQGTVRRDGGMIRVTIEVSDLDGFVVWTDRFDAPTADSMKLQERIATTLLSRFTFDSSLMRSMKIGPGPTALHAMAKIYRARKLLDQQTPGSIADALALFSDVARTAPDYARGNSGIADCYCDQFRLGLIDHATAMARTNSAARRAIETDPDSIEAHTALATVTAWIDRDPAKAEEQLQQSLKLGQNARTARVYGVLLTILERHDEAAMAFQEARAIEPFSVQQDIAEAVCHFQARRFEALTAPADPGREPSPTGEALVYRALAHLFSGNRQAARAAIAGIRSSTARHPDLMYTAAELEALLGEPAQALRALQNDAGAATFFARAMLAAALNRPDDCLQALSSAIDRRELSTAWMRSDIRLDGVRQDPRFRPLLDRLLSLADPAHV